MMKGSFEAKFEASLQEESKKYYQEIVEGFSDVLHFQDLFDEGRHAVLDGGRRRHHHFDSPLHRRDHFYQKKTRQASLPLQPVPASNFKVYHSQRQLFVLDHPCISMTLYRACRDLWLSCFYRLDVCGRSSFVLIRNQKVEAALKNVKNDSIVMAVKRF